MSTITVVHAGVVDYARAWQVQRQLHEALVGGDGPQTLLLLEHPAVYTAGRRAEPEELPHDGTPVVEVDRGGKVTWHGPGQLVGYPIVRLPEAFDVVGHVRRLEAALLRACGDLGVAATTVPGRTGVWTADGRRKLAAIGVRVRRGAAMHGFALNCDPDITAFQRIIPCGITDAGVTSLSLEAGRQVSVEEAIPIVEGHLIAVLDAADRSATTPEKVAAGV